MVFVGRHLLDGGLMQVCFPCILLCVFFWHREKAQLLGRFTVSGESQPRPESTQLNGEWLEWAGGGGVGRNLKMAPVCSLVSLCARAIQKAEGDEGPQKGYVGLRM